MFVAIFLLPLPYDIKSSAKFPVHEYSLLMKNDVLVILVSNYPSGRGELFLEGELKRLAPKFSKIYLLQTIIPQSSKVVLFLPQNAEVYSLYKDNESQSFINKLQAFISFEPFKELKRALVKHSVSLSFSLFKSIASQWRKGKEAKCALDLFISQKELMLGSTMFYSYWCDENTLGLSLLKQRKDLNFVTRLHRWDLYFEGHSPAFLPFREKIFANANTVFPISEYGKAYIQEKQLCKRSDKLIVSRLGVDDFKVNSRCINGLFSTTLTIVTISNIIPVKRLDRLINGLKAIEDFNVEWHHLGAGQETEYGQDMLKNIADKLETKPNINSTFHGFCSQETLRDKLENIPIDVAINCSESEGIPVSLMECMSAGIPVIAYDVGGIAEIVEDGINGVLMNKNTQEDSTVLKKVIIDFYNLSITEKRELSANAKTMWRSRYNADVNYQGLYNQLKSSR